MNQHTCIYTALTSRWPRSASSVITLAKSTFHDFSMQCLIRNDNVCHKYQEMCYCLLKITHGIAKCYLVAPGISWIVTTCSIMCLICIRPTTKQQNCEISSVHKTLQEVPWWPRRPTTSVEFPKSHKAIEEELNLWMTPYDTDSMRI